MSSRVLAKRKNEPRLEKGAARSDREQNGMVAPPWSYGVRSSSKINTQSMTNLQLAKAPSPARREEAPVRKERPYYDNPPTQREEQYQDEATIRRGLQNSRFLELYDRRNFVMVNGHLYLKVKLIGKGGSSNVYKVINSKGNEFALKSVSITSTDPTAASSFINEIKQLQHFKSCDKVIQLIDAEYNRHENVVLILLELGDIDLAHLIGMNMKKNREEDENAEDKPTVDKNFLRLTWEQMLEAVNVVHEHNLMHRDLKPANFMYVGSKLKLIDFGISSEISMDANTTSVITEKPFGTIGYMAPETLRMDDSLGGVKIGRPADVWALGVILYQLVYNIHPFKHTNQQLLIHEIAYGNREIEFNEIPGYTNDPESLLIIDVLKSCLNRDPKKRPTINQLLNHPYLTMRKPEVEYKIVQFIQSVQDDSLLETLTGEQKILEARRIARPFIGDSQYTKDFRYQREEMEDFYDPEEEEDVDDYYVDSRRRTRSSSNDSTREVNNFSLKPPPKVGIYLRI